MSTPIVISLSAGSGRTLRTGAFRTGAFRTGLTSGRTRRERAGSTLRSGMLRRAMPARQDRPAVTRDTRGIIRR